MSEHRLKTVQPYFDDVLHGRKTFEVRKNDRDFKVGDTLELDEYAPIVGYSGQAIIREVTYVLDSPEYCKPGYVVLGINNPTDARRAALTANIPLDRLEEIANAERDGRCLIIPDGWSQAREFWRLANMPWRCNENGDGCEGCKFETSDGNCTFKPHAAKVGMRAVCQAWRTLLGLRLTQAEVEAEIAKSEAEQQRQIDEIDITAAQAALHDTCRDGEAKP